VEDGGVVAGAEALDDGGEDDGHERLRHAVGHRRHRADRHERGVGAVGVPEHAKERHHLLVVRIRRRGPAGSGCVVAAAAAAAAVILATVSRSHSHEQPYLAPPAPQALSLSLSGRIALFVGTTGALLAALWQPFVPI